MYGAPLRRLNQSFDHASGSRSFVGEFMQAYDKTILKVIAITRRSSPHDADRPEPTGCS
jgi:hypothetical protein